MRKERECQKCHKMKPARNFYVVRKRHGKYGRGKPFRGLYSYCKSCTRKSLKTPHRLKLRQVWKENKVKQGWYSFGSPAVYRIKKRSIRMGVPFEFGGKKLKRWWKKTPEKCYYCDKTVDELNLLHKYIKLYEGRDNGIIKFKSLLNSKVVRLTIDRKLNFKGYTSSNAVKCCVICNIVKGPYLLPSDMKIISHRVMNRLWYKLFRRR